MTKTDATTAAVNQWVKEYGILLSHKYPPDHLTIAMDRLAEVYHEACLTIADAERVHRAIRRNESFMPVEATIRKWVRILNLVELGVDEETGK